MDISNLNDLLSPENVEQEIINAELVKIIVALTDTLTPKQKIVFTLRDLEALEIEEVSQITGLSAKKIKSNPIENYMSADEARFWFTGEPNMLQGMNGIEIREYIGNLEDKYNKWFAQNSWNDQYKVLIANYDQIDKKPVTKERLELLKDSIFLSQVKDFEDFKTEIILNEYFHTKAFSELWKDNDSPMKKYDDDFSNQLFVGYFGKSFTYNLKMPGKITLPNNAVIKGDTLVWRLTAYRMGHDDYVIGAQSRRTNIWTFILTGIVLAIAVGSFLIKPKKRL